MGAKLKISAVSYLNTKPFLAGMEQSGFLDRVELSLDIPSVCATKLLEGSVDIGLVPVAVIPLMKEHHIITDYCIGAVQPVRSVLLYSQVPLSQIKTILLDNQSRTSVALVKILAKELWKIDPDYTLATDGYETRIGDHTAGVVIGDRTFALNNRFKYHYDLAEGWQTLTGLPFVFACWVSNKPVDAETEQLFNEALSLGVRLAPGLAKTYENKFPEGSNLKEYLTESLSYNLDALKRQGLSRFLAYLSNGAR
ncbi:MAG TPA: menaquinone biosynthesis protein [Bacteroidia bacterium]|jgi:chorismate dehydratase|nr:menaquinone biosynthesis protein [Bacteroidia bacterium]